MGKTPRNLVLLTNAVKNYRSVSLLSGKQGLLVIWSQGRQGALLRWGRKARARQPCEGRVGKSKREILWSEDLVVGGMGEGEEVTHCLTSKGGASFPGGETV